mmetsp:Transcript_20072/g.34148  ORF Transcript_20072/g.34148 Transcript_20072/m.34148 type:complete len:406 (+) Transcript_20072:28-1245(+)
MAYNPFSGGQILHMTAFPLKVLVVVIVGQAAAFLSSTLPVYSQLQSGVSFIIQNEPLPYFLRLRTGSACRRNGQEFKMMAVAPFKQPRKQNSPGNLYVDESCIDCDVCRWMAPGTFSRIGIKSAVHTQPSTDDEKLQAYAAMVSCPVGSIRTYSPDPLSKSALDIFPAEIDPEGMPGVYHLGFHAAASFGATSYYIKRSPTGGNVMIDTPRFNSKLADTIEYEGGVDLMILTHRDDVADHAKWKKRFPHLERVIHRTEVNADTAEVETQLEGLGPWQPFDDLQILHTPGHTAGSISVLYQPSPSSSSSSEAENHQPMPALFTGDHLAFSGRTRQLTGFKQYNRGNIDLQAESIRMLASDDVTFSWMLPGHGRMVRFKSQAEKNALIEAAAEAFLQEDESIGMYAM